jgi:hypothetical protein
MSTRLRIIWRKKKRKNTKVRKEKRKSEMKLGERNRKNFRLLSALLSSPGNESIVLANCDEFDLRLELFDLLETELKKDNIAVYPLDINTQMDNGPVILTEIIDKIIHTKKFEKLAGSRKNVVFSAYGVERFDHSRENEFITYLNYRRDAFADINYPVIIWLISPMTDRIAQNAPDFWSWRSAFFEFKLPRVKLDIRRKPPGKKVRRVVASGNLPAAVGNLVGAFLKEEIDSFYVPGPPTSLSGLRKQLANSATHDKILFTGPRGCGRTMELMKLSMDLQEKFYIDEPFSSIILHYFNFHYVDLLLAITASLYGKTVEKSIRIEGKFIENLVKWSKKILSATNADVNPGDLSAENLSSFFSSLLFKIIFSGSFKDEIRTYFEQNLKALMDIVDQLIKQVENATSKQVLIIVDNLEKMPREKAIEFFIHNGDILTQPKCKIIYSIPLFCYYLPEIRQNLDSKFDGFYYMHNITIKTKNGLKAEEGISFLEKVLQKRLTGDLIEPDALDKAVRMSGGNLRVFLSLIRDAGFEALTLEKEKIGINEVDGVIPEFRNRWIRMLRKNDYEFLDRIHREKGIKRNLEPEQFSSHIDSGSIIQYENDGVWYDVHPIVEELLKEKGYTNP